MSDPNAIEERKKTRFWNQLLDPVGKGNVVPIASARRRQLDCGRGSFGSPFRTVMLVIKPSLPLQIQSYTARKQFLPVPGRSDRSFTHGHLFR